MQRFVVEAEEANRSFEASGRPTRLMCIGHTLATITRFLKLFCWPPIQVRNRLVSLLAFMAPIEPTYRFRSYRNERRYYLLLEDEMTIEFLGWSFADHSPHRWSEFARYLSDNCEPFFCETARGNTIAGLYLRALEKTELNVIFSHNNCTDMGLRFDMYWTFVCKLRCNLIAYDYSGYGLSTGRPSERNIYADIDAVFAYVSTKYSVRPETTVLFGESIGSVPTIDLATRVKFLGVVVESPLLSGLRVFCHDLDDDLSCAIDPLNNLAKVHQIESKVLVMFATIDPMLGGAKGAMLLWTRLQHKVKMFGCTDFEHNTCSTHPGFYERINRFIDQDINYNR